MHFTFLRSGLGHVECWVVAKTSLSFDYAIKVLALEALVLVAWLFEICLFIITHVGLRI